MKDKVKMEGSARTVLWLLLLVFLSGGFLAVFSFNTSPFCKIDIEDSSFFRLVGMGMTQGKLPYRDFYDMKGIYLFLIEYLAQLIHFGRAGCFLLQTINMSVVLFLIDKIHTVNKPPIGFFKRFLWLLPYLWVLSLTLWGGNLTEEFCLPYVLICVYLVRMYLKEHNGEDHPPLWGAIYGACFGIITFIRVTNAATICAVVLFILIILITNRRFKNILLNGIYFIGGFAVSILPGIIFCAKNGILKDMIEQVFTFGFTYASEDKLFSLHKNSLLYIFLFSLVPTIIYRKQIGKYFYFILIDMAALAAYLSLGNGFIHYNTMLVPHMAAAISIFTDVRPEVRKEKTVKCICILLFVCTLIGINRLVYENFRLFLYTALTDDMFDYQAIEIAANIPPEEKDSVYTYGIPSAWYVYTGIFPCIRYCDWQEHYIELSEDIRNDLKRLIEESPPGWIVTNTGKDAELPDFMRSALEKNYNRYAENDYYVLWKYSFSAGKPEN